MNTIIFFIGILLSLLSPSSSSTSDPTYTFFLQCLQNHTDQSTSVSSILVPKSSDQYSTVLTAYLRNLRFTTSATPKPLLIITPKTQSEVSAAVVCANSHNVQLRLRSGGHDYEGLSYTSVSPSQFVILDLFNFRRITVDAVKKTAYVQAGSTLGELYYSIWNQSKTLGFPAGVCTTVGVGGHVSGGGYGNMIRKYGLSVDHLLDAEIVVADGRILNRKSMGEDLFWAISGGGGASFGVILSYTVKLVSVPETVTVFNVQRQQSENTTELVFKWQSVMQTVDPNLFIRLLLQPVTDKSSSSGGKKTIRVTFIALFLGDSKTLVSTLNAAFPELGIQATDCLEMGWAESVLNWDNYPTGTPVQALLNRTYTSNYLKRKSDYVTTPISKPGLELLWKKMAELEKPGLVFNSYGGVMNQIAADATPFPHRAGSLYKIQYSANWDVAGAAIENQHLGEIRELYSFMEPYVSKNPRATFLNYRDIDIGVNTNGTFAEGKVYGEKYFIGNFPRLVKVKTAVDPGNFFRYEQSIPVLGEK